MHFGKGAPLPCKNKYVVLLLEPTKNTNGCRYQMKRSVKQLVGTIEAVRQASQQSQHRAAAAAGNQGRADDTARPTQINPHWNLSCHAHMCLFILAPLLDASATPRHRVDSNAQLG